ncbi:hypothetical protein HNR12_005493 [Streptomonospora nanhaiensis]|uniref:Uncharacterized protein n=1 Tax=Streptomonospora nanhaiensis TaxID=1323731 RepID=A0A853BWM7_9ACTN|nr:hypothetical protein [Streptomonospora nanhaiensis]NYI99216.1 hypothetical protein [Streptomonospora nanhaiensis]
MSEPTPPTAADQEAVMGVIRRLAAAASQAQREAASVPNEAAAAEQVRAAMAEVAEQARADMRAIGPAAVAALHAAMHRDDEE